ncbi:MAG: tRNA lysidine(34) synthetase TilS [Oscillospiraceae bacterium]|jgi:tRNA(Ile)-lysidine synthase|nr:tRNA lysidine(34) synthetase TilS [Oscillospiraceae bacterium]
MLANIKNVIKKYNMLSLSGKQCSPVRIIVALSGGADSVCLLLALHELRDELNIELQACHVNHKLRGNSSDSDERFVRELCGRLGIELHVRAINVKALQKKHRSLEECAREARYSYFSEIGTKAIIATAHTAGDNCETVLFNLVRGTGLRGLCGIPPVRDNIIRPLIETARAEVLAFLEAENAEYVTDESNYSEEFTRNYLRLSVIPQLEKINPSLTDGLTRMCSVLRHDEEYLRMTALLALEEAHVKGGVYKLSILINQLPAIQSRIISLLLSQNNISPSNLRITSVISLLKTGGKINLARDKFAIVRDNLLYIKIIPQNYRKN